MRLASNLDVEEGDPITERPRREQERERNPCGFFASDDSIINFLLVNTPSTFLVCFRRYLLYSRKTSWQIAIWIFQTKLSLHKKEVFAEESKNLAKYQSENNFVALSK